MSEPPSYPGSGNNPEYPNGDYPPPPTHQAYGSSGQPDYGQYGGQQYGQQYGGQQYGAWQGGNDASRPTDGVSIAAFVLSLTCCLSLVGLILGFFGLKRTKDDQRKGRWAAITAIPVGIIGTLILAGGIGWVAWFSGQLVTPDNAEVGQCVNIDDGDDNNVTLTKKDCGEEHDGQLFAVEKLSGEDAQAINDNGGNATLTTCSSGRAPLDEISADDKRAIVRWATEDPKDPKAGDTVICFFEVESGKLEKSYVD